MVANTYERLAGRSLASDIDAKAGRLVLNPKEAAQVREIFEIAARTESLEEAARQVRARGLKTKAWSTEKGRVAALYQDMPRAGRRPKVTPAVVQPTPVTIGSPFGDWVGGSQHIAAANEPAEGGAEK